MDSSPFDFSVPQEPAMPRPFQMAYWEAYTFVFEHPNWMVHLLLAMLCQFIPIVGPIVLLGYEYELILALHRRTNMPYPEFDFGRFSDYLTRGIWPFLVNMIQMMIIIPVIYGVMLVGFFLIAILSVGAGAPGQPPSPIVFLIGVPVFLLFMVVLTTVAGMLSLPMRLRAGLTKDFGDAFNFGFIKEFIQLVGWELVFVNLFIAFTAPLVALVGMLICFVGVYPATILIFMAFAHLNWQLYELYLSRGGTPIRIPEDDIYDAQVV